MFLKLSWWVDDTRWQLGLKWKLSFGIIWQIDCRAAKSGNSCSFPRRADETADNSILTLQGQGELLAALMRASVWWSIALLPAGWVLTFNVCIWSTIVIWFVFTVVWFTYSLLLESADKSMWAFTIHALECCDMAEHEMGTALILAIPYQRPWGSDRIINQVNCTTFTGQIYHCKDSLCSYQDRGTACFSVLG